MTKRQETLADITQSTLNSPVKGGYESNKRNKDMQKIKALQTKLEELHAELELKRNIIQDSKSALMHLEEEINIKTNDKNQIPGRLAEIERNVEEKHNLTNILHSRTNEYSDKIKRAEVYRNSFSPEYTEWHYNYSSWVFQGLIARFPGHHPMPQCGGMDVRIEADHVNLAWGYPIPSFCQFNQHLTDMVHGSNFVHKYSRPGVYNSRYITCHYGTDKGYEQYITDANNYLNQVTAIKNQIEHQLKVLSIEIKDQRGQKINLEGELCKIEEALKVVEIKKEEMEVKLQLVLQEKESIEARCVELEELIAKAQIVEKVLKTEKTVEEKGELLAKKLQDIIEQIENKGYDTAKECQLLESMEHLDNIHKEVGYKYTNLLEKSMQLIDLHSIDESEYITDKSLEVEQTKNYDIALIGD